MVRKYCGKRRKKVLVTNILYFSRHVFKDPLPLAIELLDFLVKNHEIYQNISKLSISIFLTCK